MTASIMGTLLTPRLGEGPVLREVDPLCHVKNTCKSPPNEGGRERKRKEAVEVCAHTCKASEFGLRVTFFFIIIVHYVPFRSIIIKLLLNLVVCTALQALLVARSCGHVHHRSHHTLLGNLVDAVVPFMGESFNDWTLATFLKSMSFLCSHWMHISIVVHACAEPGDRVEVDEPIAQIETDKLTIDVNSPEAGIIQKPRKVILLPLATHVASSDDKVVQDARQPSPPADSPQPGPTAEKIDKQVLKVSSAVLPKSSPSEPQLTPQGKGKTNLCLVPMPRLRKRVTTRLKDSQNTLQSEYKDAFAEKYDVKLGLMSGHTVSGLQNQPIINSVIDRDDIVYRDYIDISIAVGTQKRLMVELSRMLIDYLGSNIRNSFPALFEMKKEARALGLPPVMKELPSYERLTALHTKHSQDSQQHYSTTKRRQLVKKISRYQSSKRANEIHSHRNPDRWDKYRNLMDADVLFLLPSHRIPFRNRRSATHSSRMLDSVLSQTSWHRHTIKKQKKQ
ncbi:hypothetical protein C4D60_Mb10t17780 [Musa balbisiana]|uniref:Dihydrolipoamide acetyltransferase component of pyruvate dehydrogenase complex n=1 Tax=Musa balbisiana TaxID=52838 RepID=A0A4S8IXZ9_MUSBA|nr:hypothetical protein C4D60_Mb10t17780 [Musa balbisiana]